MVRFAFSVLLAGVLVETAAAQTIRLRLFGTQQSSRSISSSTPMLTFPQGGMGSISSGGWRPFVTGVIPIVGHHNAASWQYPAVHWRPAPAWQIPAANHFRVPEAQQPTEDQIRRQEIRDALRLRTMERYVRRAERELQSGRNGAAQVYYRMALKRAQGEMVDQIRNKLEELSSQPPIVEPPRAEITQ